MVEIKVNISRGRIIRSNVEEDGSCTLFVDVEETSKTKTHGINDAEVLIEASKLCLSDKFMQHKPRTNNEKKLKNLLEGVIKTGIKDFWRPRLDPSFNENKDGIVYASGNKPAVGKSYNWWKKTAREYNSRRHSRLGTKSEYVAFLGVLIKSLVSEGWSIADAWNAVCNDSKDLGHYRNSENANGDFELTGSRRVCGFYDLANTYKILAEDEETGGFWLAGGGYNYFSDCNPLAALYHNVIQSNVNNNSVGWLVLEEGSTDY